MFTTKQLPETFADLAQDGSHYDGLLGTEHGWLSDCSLPPSRTSRAVRHLAHDEIWFVRSGAGQLWRSRAGQIETIDVTTGTCATIPAETAFQFRTTGAEPLRFLIVQVPPWPANGPGFEYVSGQWVTGAGDELSPPQ